MHSPETGAPPLSRRIFDTFFAPRRLATTVRDGAPWHGPLLITTLVAIAAAAALPAEFFLERVENPVNRLGRPVTVTSSPEEIVRWGRYLHMFAAGVEHPMVVVLVAALMTLVFGAGARGRVTLREFFALAAHAFLVSAVGVLLALGWRMAWGDAEAHPSLALLAGGSAVASESPVVAFLSLVNPFTLWMLVVLAVGVHELNRRWSLPAASAILVGAYLATALALSTAG